MESVYIESTIPSYLTARNSPSVELSNAQAITKEWWKTRRINYRVYTSTFTLREISRGDSEAASFRQKSLEGIKQLTITPDIEFHGQQIGAALQIPQKSLLDAYHVATCIVHEIDFLLTWNCTHLANPVLQKQLIDYCRFQDLHVPVICTPEELLRVK